MSAREKIAADAEARAERKAAEDARRAKVEAERVAAREEAERKRKALTDSLAASKDRMVRQQEEAEAKRRAERRRVEDERAALEAATQASVLFCSTGCECLMR